MSKSPWFISKEKKTGKSNFWSSRSSGYSTSNYWLKDSIFEKKQSHFFNDPESVEKESKYDHFQLAQYQRAISNFVRILTGRNDIVVKYNERGDSYTDGKTITLSPNIKEKEFDTAVGLALHEGSHILYSDFSLLHKMISKYIHRGTEETERRKLFLNLVEDLYIDAVTYSKAPGYRGYYASLYQTYFGDSKIEEGLWSKDYCEPTWNNYLFHLVNIRNPKRNLKALPGLEKVFGMLNLPNITRLTTPDSRLTLAEQIYEECEKHIDATKQMAESMLGQGAGTNNGGNNGKIDYPALNEMLEKMGESNGEGDVDLGGDKFVASNGVNIQEEVENTNYIELDKLSDKAKAALDKMLDKQKQFIKGQIFKPNLSKADQQKVTAFAEIEVDKKIVASGGQFGKGGVPLYIFREINDGFINTVGHRYGISYTTKTKESKIETGINRGKLLAKKLQVRNEERVLKTSRLDSGKIDKRLLHEIGFDNYDIFSKINVNSYKPSFIHLSIDQSGSMDTSIDACMEMAAMLATASKYINNIHLVVSLRSTFDTTSIANSFNNRYKHLPYLITIFDSKKHGINHIRKYFPRVCANGLTPEGLAFEGIMRETMNQAQNKEAYFINICDGEPYFSYDPDGSGSAPLFEYSGEQAKKHSREQMRRMESAGIKYITYFIGCQHDFRAVKECYGDNSVNLEYGSDVHTVASTMNKKLLSNH